MKIIFIHGMNQQNYNAAALKQHWIDIFNQGLHYAQIPMSATDFDIEMAYYADLLLSYQSTKLVSPARSATLSAHAPQVSPDPAELYLYAPMQWLLNDQTDSKAQTAIPLLPQFLKQAHPDFPTRLSAYAALLKDHLFKDLASLLDHFPNIHAHLIHEFLLETYLYLSDNEFMQAVHQRIQACFDPNQTHLIVAHSLGSVIAYNFLHQYPQYHVDGFISLGSPLAFRVIQEKIYQPISAPNNLKGDWINFFSTEDFLTAFPLTNPPFDFSPPILNQAIQTFSHQPHQITGYLQHPNVIKNIVKIVKKA